MDFEGNLHSRELESEIGLTFDTDLQDPEIFCFENSEIFFFSSLPKHTFGARWELDP